MVDRVDLQESSRERILPDKINKSVNLACSVVGNILKDWERGVPVPRLITNNDLQRIFEINGIDGDGLWAESVSIRHMDRNTVGAWALSCLKLFVVSWREGDEVVGSFLEKSSLNPEDLDILDQGVESAWKKARGSAHLYELEEESIGEMGEVLSILSEETKYFSY